MKRIVLAFDIERSGATDEYDTIAIGASVVDDEFNELDSLFLPCYFPKHSTNKALLTLISWLTWKPMYEATKFEPRCWDEFWSKHTDTLDTLTYTGDLTKEEREAEMIQAFQNFRIKWENYAKENGLEYIMVSDNCVYDGGFINELIFKYLPGTLPIPYNANGSGYNSFTETFSIQIGLLMAVEPEFTQQWGFSKKIRELYDTPDIKKDHDHNPANDAYCIAYDRQVLFGIQEGTIKKRE